jgi:hypothetical protein
MKTIKIKSAIHGTIQAELIKKNKTEVTVKYNGLIITVPKSSIIHSK